MKIGRFMHHVMSLWAITMACAMAADAPGMSSETHPGDRTALAQATAAMCGKSIVILGEATHGDGHTDAVKVELVKRLVMQCGFNGVLFESSTYEFAPVAKAVSARQPVTPELIAAAVGGLWKFDRQVQPLFAFLADQANAGKVQLGGLDLQAGGFEQPYGNDVMMGELSAGLPAGRRERCQALYRVRAYDDNPPDGMSEQTLTETLKSCLAEIDADPASGAMSVDERRARASQLKNLGAWLEFSSLTPPERVRLRDRMMAENAEQFFEHLGRPAKTVIWAHNGHAARNTAALSDYGSSGNLGTLLGQRHGDKLFALATTACGGEYRWSMGINKAIPAAPADSLEAQSCRAGADTSAFVGSEALKRAGSRAAAVYGHAYMQASWAAAFDGVLVLNAEYPPTSTRPGW